MFSRFNEIDVVISDTTVSSAILKLTHGTLGQFWKPPKLNKWKNQLTTHFWCTWASESFRSKTSSSFFCLKDIISFSWQSLTLLLRLLLVKVFWTPPRLHSVHYFSPGRIAVHGLKVYLLQCWRCVWTSEEAGMHIITIHCTPHRSVQNVKTFSNV